MPTGEAREQRIAVCDRKTVEAVMRIAACYSAQLARRLGRVRLYCSSKARRVVYAFTGDRVHPRIATYRVVCAGIPVAVVSNKSLRPALGMLSLARLWRVQVESHYVRVKSSASLLFTYGRDIFVDSVEAIEIRYECNNIPLAVIDSNGDLLGFGLLSGRGKRVLIQNLLDVGWYLRSGV